MIIFFFVDGLGIGKRDEANPLYVGRFPFFEKMFRKYTSYVDAVMNVPGLPQSATGQTSIFTGYNAARLIGRHKEGFPGGRLSGLIKKESLFKKLQDHGYRPTFSNAYIIDDMEALSRQRFLSVTSLMAMTTEKSVRGLKQLAKGEAVFHDITNISLVDGSVPSPQQEALLLRFGNIVDHALLKEVPLVDPEKAAKNLYNIARNYHVTLFEYFLTDRAGHDGDMDKALEVLQRLEVFTETLLGLMNMNRQTFILTSDHGNVEDLSVPTHTYNPVPFTVAGRGERYLKGISSLYEITPSIMENVHYLL
ncbi:MAG TPA: hypothetical protein PLJ93_00855 [Candidatus Mcinerneyibacteriales bacterium]|nr:hypothetical protein [Candidatus Mcinerneyibacteriales bacterium]